MDAKVALIEKSGVGLGVCPNSECLGSMYTAQGCILSIEIIKERGHSGYFSVSLL